MAHFQNGVSVLGRILERGINFRGIFFQNGVPIWSTGRHIPTQRYPSAPPPGGGCYALHQHGIAPGARSRLRSLTTWVRYWPYRGFGSVCFNDEFGFVSNFCSTPVCLADPASIRLTRSVQWFPTKSYSMFMVERILLIILASAELVIESENNFAEQQLPLPV